MTEYTSLGVSRRLAEAGFKAEPDAGVWSGESGCYHYCYQLNDATDWSHMARAYRAGTLMEWLLENGLYFDRIEHHSVEGFIVRFQDANPNHVCPLEAIEDTLCDALGEVVLAVLAKEAEHE